MKTPIVPSLKKILAGAAVLLAGGVAAVFLFRPTTVTAARVGVRDVTPAVHGVGTIEAKIVVPVSSKITDRIVSVLVDQGDPITTGQVVARLDDTQIAAEVRQGEANVRTAEAQLRDLLAGARSEEIDSLRAQLAASQASRELAEHDFVRAQQLAMKQIISQQDLDRARQVQDVSSNQERDLQQKLRLALAGPRADQVEAVRSQARAAEAALALARERLKDTVITAPLDGYVVSRELEAGAIVNPGIPIFKVVDPRTAWATIYVDEQDTAELALGHPVDITIRSMPGRHFRGCIARVRRESDRVTEQLAVDITLNERPERLTLGEQIEATIQLPVQRGTVALPVAAIVRRPDATGALAVVDGRIRFIPLRLGAIDDAGWVQALDGLSPGDDVILAPGQLADPTSEGQRVRIARRASGPGTTSP
jgi:HlyD family secretion protein